MDSYQEEGDTIRVKKFGGMMGISKALVSRIEEVKAETPPEVIKEEEKSENEKEKPVEITEEEKKKAEQEKAARMQAFLEERRQVMREMEIVAAGLKDAQAKNNKAEKRKWLMDRAGLLTRLSELEKSVKAVHDGKLPAWWQNDS